MKKHILVFAGVALITTPLIASGIGTGTNRPIIGSYLSFSATSQSIRFPSKYLSNFMSSGYLSSIGENIPPDGKIGHVTYYGKREGKKEIIDIFLDSQTSMAEDACFLMVTVKNSKGEIEYRLDTTIVKFKGTKHYIIELDPPKLENETHRTVKVAATFYSSSVNQQQEVNFDIDYTEHKEYIFDSNQKYTSECPIVIRYTQDGKKERIYESFDFNSLCNISYERPIFDINRLSFTYSYQDMEVMLPNYEECYLLIDDVYDSNDFDEENEMKKIPLSLVSENNVIKFCLLNSFYYDSSDGMVYKSDKSGRKEINNLILPTTYKGDASIYYELHLKKFSASESDFIFKSYATFDVKWFGSCDDSYFCVSSVDELLEDVNYSGGVIV